jgi:hypothetical protein
MTLDYIAGFLDGEGSITLCRDRKSAKFKSPMVSFSNNARCILEDIRQFLPMRGSIVSKADARPTSGPSFTLQYANAALELCDLLQDKLRHPSKRARARLLVSGYKSVTQRNGKYSADMVERKLSFEEQFSEL